MFAYNSRCSDRGKKSIDIYVIGSSSSVEGTRLPSNAPYRARYFESKAHD